MRTPEQGAPNAFKAGTKHSPMAGKSFSSDLKPLRKAWLRGGRQSVDGSPSSGECD
jgi:hypothetical protein